MQLLSWVTPAWQARSAWRLPSRLRVALVGILMTVAGVLLGRLGSSPEYAELSRDAFGHAYSISGDQARSALFSLLAVQLTSIGLVLSASTTALYGVLTNQSLRLFRFIEPRGPLLRAMGSYALMVGFVITAVRRLGPSDVERPRPVVMIGILLALALVVMVVLDAALSFRKQDIGMLLRLVTTKTERAIARMRSRIGTEMRIGGSLDDPRGAVLRAPRAGYLVDVRGPALARFAQRLGVTVRIDRAFGEYVGRGEVLGRVSAHPSPPALHRMAHHLVLDDHRSPALDVGAGVRVLVDISERALSPGVNDPYTACEALYRLRGLLTELAAVPDGAFELLDDAGTPRVTIARAPFEEVLRLSVDGPSRYGASDPDVLDAILDIAAAVGRVPSRRELAQRVIARALADARAAGMDPERLETLRTRGAAIASTLGTSEVIERLWCRHGAWVGALLPGQS